mmetsp:Transcript_39478/g.98855  ORF Transcript_39478/g.98855 Transcript_39478/m.98855 type:complete len:259 (+) Transcript_39478:1419-2195(+)
MVIDRLLEDLAITEMKSDPKEKREHKLFLSYTAQRPAAILEAYEVMGRFKAVMKVLFSVLEPTEKASQTDPMEMVLASDETTKARQKSIEAISTSVDPRVPVQKLKEALSRFVGHMKASWGGLRDDIYLVEGPTWFGLFKKESAPKAEDMPVFKVKRETPLHKVPDLTKGLTDWTGTLLTLAHILWNTLLTDYATLHPTNTESRGFAIVLNDDAQKEGGFRSISMEEWRKLSPIVVSMGAAIQQTVDKLTTLLHARGL